MRALATVLFFLASPAAATSIWELSVSEPCQDPAYCEFEAIATYARGVVDALHGGRCWPPGGNLAPPEPWRPLQFELEVADRFYRAASDDSAFEVVRRAYEELQPCTVPQRAK